MEYSLAQEFRLIDLSYDWKQIAFNNNSYSQKKIKDLNLYDLHWLIQRRIHLDVTINIVILKIQGNYQKINAYYDHMEAQWYDLIMREIIILPVILWGYHHKSFGRLREILQYNTLRKIDLDKDIIERFIRHQPKEATWTKQDQEDFDWNISKDIAGNQVEALHQISKLYVALLNNQKVRIESTPYNKVIFNYPELKKHFQSIYGQFERLPEMFEDMERLIIIKL